MKKNLTIFILSLAVMAAALWAGPRGQVAAGESDVRLAIDSLETKLGWIAYRANLERWQQIDAQSEDSLAFFDQLALDVAARSQVYETLRGQRAQLSDNIDQRRYDLVYPVVVHAQIDGGHLIRGLWDSLTGFYDRSWCRWQEGRVSPEFLTAALAKTRGQSNRALAYRTASSPGQEVAQQLSRLFRLRNQATRRMGYNDYMSLTLDLANVDGDDYLAFLDAVDSVTRRPFESLTGELRTSMGTEPLEVYDWDSRFSRTISEADALFPVDSQMVYLRRFVTGLGFNIDRSPIYWHAATENVAGDKTAALVIAPKNDIRIITRLTDGLQSYVSLVQAFALAIRGVLVTQDTDLLARTVEPGWERGIASTFVRLAVETEWLQSAAGASRDLQIRLARASQAIRLLRLRLLLVDAHFEYQAYRNPGRDLNTQYWTLFDEYVGLPRHDDLTPWAGNKLFVAQPLAAYYQLLGECAAGQNMNYLSRNYDRLVNNEDLSSFLTHSYFRFGARYRWPELVERATNERLSPDYLVSN